MIVAMTFPSMPPSGGVPTQAPTPPTMQPRVRSEVLLQGGRELEIEHAGAVYRLRVTSLGKLILTK